MRRRVRKARVMEKGKHYWITWHGYTGLARYECGWICSNPPSEVQITSYGQQQPHLKAMAFPPSSNSLTAPWEHNVSLLLEDGCSYSFTMRMCKSEFEAYARFSTRPASEEDVEWWQRKRDAREAVPALAKL